MYHHAPNIYPFNVIWPSYCHLNYDRIATRKFLKIKVQWKYNFKMLFISVWLWFEYTLLFQAMSACLLCQAMSAFVWLSRVYACICLIKSRVLLDPEFWSYLLETWCRDSLWSEGVQNEIWAKKVLVKGVKTPYKGVKLFK